jgi:hypothetical protein
VDKFAVSVFESIETGLIGSPEHEKVRWRVINVDADVEGYRRSSEWELPVQIDGGGCGVGNGHDEAVFLPQLCPYQQQPSE